MGHMGHAGHVGWVQKGAGSLLTSTARRLIEGQNHTQVHSAVRRHTRCDAYLCPRVANRFEKVISHDLGLSESNICDNQPNRESLESCCVWRCITRTAHTHTETTHQERCSEAHPRHSVYLSDKHAHIKRPNSLLANQVDHHQGTRGATVRQI